MRFSPSFLDDIRARVPISAVVGARVRFDAKKSNAARGDYWGCCPFHGEKTPSFHADDRRGRYYCFGCGAGGDIFGFLTDLDGLSFADAVAKLAEQAGLPMPAPAAREPEEERRRAALLAALEAAARFYERSLSHNSSAAAAAARAYLRERGVSAAAQSSFRLGYAPADYGALRDACAAAAGGGDAAALLSQAGLALADENGGGCYSRFRDRIMFPIADMRGQAIAFGGRALSAQARAKYLNSPETELFHKGRILYNLAQARQKARAAPARAGEAGAESGAAARPLLVVEGYMDVVALAQAGFGEAVAPLGTALTEEQLALLWRHCPQPVLCFDGDKAGLAAAYRALDKALPLLTAAVSLRFVMLPGGQDPDDIIRAGGAPAFAALLAEARPAADILWQRETEGQSFASPESRAALENRLRLAALAIKDASLRSYYLRDIKQRLWDFFRPAYSKGSAALGKTGSAPARRGGFGAHSGAHFGAGGSGLITDNLAHSSFVRGAARGGGFAPREAIILALLAARPALWHEDFDNLAALEFSSPELQKFYRVMQEILAEFAASGAYEGGVCDGGAEQSLAAHDEAEAKALAAKLAEKGQKPVLDKITAFTAHLGVKAAHGAASAAQARAVLKQALALYRRAHSLHKQIEETEADLHSGATSDDFARLRALRQELSRADNLEAAADEA